MVISAMPSASICCSPPLIEPARCRRRSPAPGTARRPAVTKPGIEQQAGDTQILLDRQIGENVVALRHQRNAMADILRDRRGGGVDAVNVDLPAARTHGADDAAQQRRLAGPVVTENAKPCAVGERERDVVEHRQRTISCGQVLNLQHRSVPEIEFGELRIADQLGDRVRAP